MAHATAHVGHHGPVTETATPPASPPTPERPELPPDPVQYDSVRNEHARRRGLPQPYIAGGNDPALGETLTRERRYLRILVAMIVVIVAMGFVLGIVGALISVPA